MDWKPKATIPTFVGALIFLLDLPGRWSVLVSVYSYFPPFIHQWMFQFAALAVLAVGVTVGVRDPKVSLPATTLYDHSARPITFTKRKKSLVPLIAALLSAVVTAGCVIGVVRLYRAHRSAAPLAVATAVSQTAATPTAVPHIAPKPDSHKGPPRTSVQLGGSIPAPHPSDNPAQSAPSSALPMSQMLNGDLCFNYGSFGNLFLDHRASGWILKNQDAEIPIVFKLRASANAFLAETRKHSGICWTPTIADDLKSGYDVFVIWQGTSPSSPSTLPLPTISATSLSASLIFPICKATGLFSGTNLSMEQDEERGIVSIQNGPDVLFTVNSMDKANRALDSISSNSTLGGQVCLIGVSDENKSPSVVYMY